MAGVRNEHVQAYTPQLVPNSVVFRRIDIFFSHIRQLPVFIKIKVRD